MKILVALLLATYAYSQTATNPTTLLVTNAFNITNSGQYIDNRSVQRQCNVFTFSVASGTGSWSAQLEYANSSFSGPWFSFGAAAAVTYSSPLGVGYGAGYHPWVRINTTAGTTVANFSCEQNLFLPAPANGVINTPTFTGLAKATSGSPNLTLATSTDVINTFGNVTPNQVFASPASGTGPMLVRPLVVNDIPALPYQAPLAFIGGGALVPTAGNSFTLNDCLIWGTAGVTDSGATCGISSLPSGTGNQAIMTPNGSSGGSALRPIVAADLSFLSGTQNKVLATPNGSSGIATLRALTIPDIPALPYQAIITSTVTPSWETASLSGSTLAISPATSKQPGYTVEAAASGTIALQAGPITETAKYNFQAQAPGGTLTASTPATITMTPVPYGINGADTGHYVYISGGTGTAESCLITGGTATSGSSSGTITCTPRNSHSGGWTVSSATAGIQEALVQAGTTPIEVILPYGDVTVHGPVTFPVPIQDPTGWNGWSLTGRGWNTSRVLVAADFCAMTSGSCVQSVNGVFIVPNALGPAPRWHDLAVILPQPYGSARSSYNQWPPVIYVNGGNQGTIDHLNIVGAWTGIWLHGFWNGSTYTNGAAQWAIKFLFMSAFSVGIDAEGAADTNRISNYHFWPFTDIAAPSFADQQEMMNPNVIAIKAADEVQLMISDSLMLSGQSIFTYAGHQGGAIVQMSNIWIDVFGELTVDAGSQIIWSTGFMYLNPSFGIYNCSAPALNVLSGNLVVNGVQFSKTCTSQNMLSFAPATSAQVYATLANGIFAEGSMDTATASMIYIAPVSTFTSRLSITNNTFVYGPAGSYSNPIISYPGSTFTKINLVGNQVQDTGSGVFYSQASNGGGVVANNVTGGNWSLSLPAWPSTGIAGGVINLPVSISSAFFITGTAAIATINSLDNRQDVYLAFTDASPGGVTTGGNVARTLPAVQGQIVHCQLNENAGTWYCE